MRRNATKTNNSPCVSIIIDNYNYGQYIDKAIESALNQTHTNTEVIVVDDGSTDDSADRIRQFDDRIIVILKDNGGQASAFNTGYQRCNGDVIIFLDADDLLLPHAAASSVEALMDATLSCVTWQMRVIDSDGKQQNTLHPANALAEGDLLPTVAENGPFSFTYAPTSGNAWSRRFLEQVMPIPEEVFRRGPDGYLIHIAPLYGHTHWHRQHLSCYRHHGANYLAAKSEFEKREVLMARYQALSDSLAIHLNRLGVAFNRANWSHEHWNQLELLRREVEETLPPGEMMILEDGDTLNVGSHFLARPRRYLMERNGGYWGNPVDGQQAITNLEQLRQQGASYFVIIWYQFWWFDQYPEFHHYLLETYRCSLSSDRVVIFNLEAVV